MRRQEFGSVESGIPLLKQNFRSSRISLKNMDECGLNAYIRSPGNTLAEGIGTDAMD